MGFFSRLAADLSFIQDFLGPTREEQTEELVDSAPQELKDAEKRCPDVKFVKSCREFYVKRGFLSEKQRDALRYAGTPNRRRNYYWGNDPEY